MRELRIVMLSIHPLNDSRISKYEISLSDDYSYNVYNIHFLPEPEFLSFSQFNIPISRNKVKKRLVFLFFQKYLLSRIKNIISNFSDSVFIIHDPIILMLAKRLKKMNVTVIYDRHEYYEDLKWYNVLSEYLIYEKLNIKYIDSFICVNEHHAKATGDLLLKKEDKKDIIVIHNYPSIKRKLDKEFLIKNKSAVPMISYIGSMNWNADRDIQLMIDCIEMLEKNNIIYKCVFAGKVFDERLLDKLLCLQKKSMSQFEYRGVVERNDAIDITVKSHIGFFFLNNSYVIPCSPNKIFEYIYYGVIPFTRFNCSDDLSGYDGCFYDFNMDKSKIINDFLNLVLNQNLINQKVKHILDKGCPFLWENDIKKIFALFK